MSLRKDYPYNEALDDLEEFINKHVVHEEHRNVLLEIINESRHRKTVPMRGIHEKFIEYVREYKINSALLSDEAEMIDELMHFWG